MKVAGIIAEFNPFHNGHKYLIDLCKKEYGADYVVVVMSGDYVQRGSPALVSKFSRAKMSLLSGADLVLELPVYYSLGSAEYFAEGAISVLSGLGVITDLFFGSECVSIEKLSQIADVMVKEPPQYCDALKKSLSEGDSFPTARAKAVEQALSSQGPLEDIFSSPNSILAVEYLKALKRRNSGIIPHAVRRLGASYEDGSIKSAAKRNGARYEGSNINPEGVGDGSAPLASALGIRNTLFESNITVPADLEKVGASLLTAMPQESFDVLSSYEGLFLDCSSFSQILQYKLTLEKNNGFTKYADVSMELSNRIVSELVCYKDFDDFCGMIKTKNFTYTRISRCLMHILLGITQQNMDAYKADDYTAYGRILGMKTDASSLLSKIHDSCTFPVPGRLKDADKKLSPMQLQLFNETLTASEIYNRFAKNGIASEYSLKALIL